MYTLVYEDFRWTDINIMTERFAYLLPLSLDLYYSYISYILILDTHLFSCPFHCQQHESLLRFVG